MDEIAVAFGFDAGYAPHAGAAVASIVAASRGARLRFLMFVDDVPPPLRAMMERCAPAARFDWIEPNLGAIEGPQRGHITRATYLRLLIPDYAPADVDKVLYLDCDLVAYRDVSALWSFDLQGAPAAAVRDDWIDPAAFAQRWGLGDPRGGYFNAGVMLLDLPTLRAQGGFARAADFLRENGPSLDYLDQDALNFAFWGNWAELDPVWNVQRSMLLKHMRGPQRTNWRPGRRPGIVHYTTDQKPWKAGVYHPYSWLYFRALAQTPFGDRAVSVSFAGRARSWSHWVRRVPFLRA